MHTRKGEVGKDNHMGVYDWRIRFFLLMMAR
jgi:hypothetical protein